MATQLETAQSMLDKWLAAEAALADSNAQSYTIGNRSLTRVDLKYISERIAHWEGRVKSLSTGGIRARRVIFRDL